MKFTRREKIILSIAALLYVVVMLVEQKSLDNWEWLVPPAVILFAWLINTDPEKAR